MVTADATWAGVVAATGSATAADESSSLACSRASVSAGGDFALLASGTSAIAVVVLETLAAREFWEFAGEDFAGPAIAVTVAELIRAGPPVVRSVVPCTVTSRPR